MNLNDEDTIMNDCANMIITASPHGRRCRLGRLREHMAQQPRSVSLRDFGSSFDNDQDAPATPPPSSSKSLHRVLSHDGKCLTNPPEVPRHDRPINRRLLLQEAQERLSLPDLFAPRTPGVQQQRTRGGQQRRRVRPNHTTTSFVPTIQPRFGQSWGDCYDGEVQSHRMSTRSIFGNMNPGDF